MIDTGAEIRLRLEHAEGVKTAALRWPTEAEWIRRENESRTVIHELVAGGTFTETRGSERAAFDLFKAIRLDTDGPVFDEFEATEVIDRLLQADSHSVERRGAEVDVRLAVVGGEQVRHTFALPNARERHAYGKLKVLVTFHRWREWHRRLSEIAGMWADLVVETEGYKGEVPLPHKAVALEELMRLSAEVGSPHWVLEDDSGESKSIEKAETEC